MQDMNTCRASPAAIPGNAIRYLQGAECDTVKMANAISQNLQQLPALGNSFIIVYNNYTSRGSISFRAVFN